MNERHEFNLLLNRAANALEHIACSLLAIEMMQAAEAGGEYEECLHIHQRFSA